MFLSFFPAFMKTCKVFGLLVFYSRYFLSSERFLFSFLSGLDYSTMIFFLLQVPTQQIFNELKPTNFELKSKLQKLYFQLKMGTRSGEILSFSGCISSSGVYGSTVKKMFLLSCFPVFHGIRVYHVFICCHVCFL